MLGEVCAVVRKENSETGSVPRFLLPLDIRTAVSLLLRFDGEKRVIYCGHLGAA